MESTTGLNVTIELPQSTSAKSQFKVKRKRHKVIKSCAFCRRRKLRCDQKKPMCSSCVTRGLKECLYTNKSDHPLGTKELFGSLANGKLSSKLNQLEQEIKEEKRIESTDDGNGSTAGTIPCKKLLSSKNTSYNIYDSGIEAVPPTDNVLQHFYTLQCKEGGRRIYYGPTCMRTFIARANMGLLEKFKQIWLKVKITRKKWKKANGFSMLREINLLEEAPQFSDSLPSTLLQEVCRALPSYEKAKSAMELFFEYKELFEINTIFDQKKVMKDFYEAVVPGEPSEENGERPIVNLAPSGKKNYYKAAIIVQIIILANFHDKIPRPIEKFFIFLTGLSTGKVMYIERAQFLMFRYLYSMKYAHTGGDNSHVMLLVDSMVSTATYLGLSHNIRLLYEGQEDVVGDLQTLENLWCWIVYADFDIAFQIGRPLKITAAEVNKMPVDKSKTFYGLLKRFLSVSRPMISDIYENTTSPNLTEHCERLIEFIEREFPPMGYYTDINLIGEVSLRNIRILCQALSMLVAFYCLRNLAFKEMGPYLKDSLIKCALISFSMATNLTIHSFQLDKKYFPDMMKPECASVTPYISYSISLISGLIPRGIIAFYGLAYNRMTLFESGLLFAVDKHETVDCDLNNLRAQDDAHVSFISSFRMVCLIFDRFSNPDDELFKMTVRRSYKLVATNAMERVCRTVVEKVLECRSNAESVWISSSERQIFDSNAVGKSETPQLPEEQLVVKDVLVPEETYVAGANNSDINVNPVPTEQEVDMSQMIADEFWETYNIGWQEILDNTEHGSMFSDMI